MKTWTQFVSVVMLSACFLESSLPHTANAAETEIPGWGTTVDPDGDCSFHLDEGSLTVIAPGPTHGLSIELNRMNAPRVLRSIAGDFSAEVRVDTKFTPGEQTIAQRTAYQGSGLLLVKDQENYARIEAAVLVRGGTPRFYVNFELRVDGRLQRFGTPDDFSWDGNRSVWLRLERRGNLILGAATQELGKWTYLNPKSTELPDTLELGVAAINASSEPLRAKFADLRVFTAERAKVPPKSVEEAFVRYESDLVAPSCCGTQRRRIVRRRSWTRCSF